MSGGSVTPICPCGTILFPQAIYNPPGLSTIAYRPGDYIGFRHALLQSLSRETELTQQVDGRAVPNRRQGVEGHLAGPIVEWCAYLSDVLIVYNECLANESYLHTAQLP